MAEGWTNFLHGEIIEAWSAGIEKHGLNPAAVQVMAESGVDISSHSSTLINELPEREFDYVITVCDHAHESCPLFPGTVRHIHKGFADPPRLAAHASDPEEILMHYRTVRDQIKNFIDSFPENLDRLSAPSPGREIITR
jgi:arsenate reductase